MDIQLKKELISINETVMRSDTQVLVQNDIIVPDIKSDMAKILQVDACASVDSVAVVGGAAEISGKINLNILYVPEGDIKPICAIDSSVPFMTKVENTQIRENSKCIAAADVGHVEFLMLNSRKLNVKVVVELETRCIHTSEAELVCDISPTEGVEKRSGTLDIYKLVYAGHSKLSIGETLDFPAGKPDAVCVLKADAKICERDIRLITDKIVVRGSVSVCTLYVSADNSLEFCEHELPFTEVLEAEGVNDTCMCEVDMNICDTSVKLRPNTNGDMRLIDVELTVDAGVNVTQSTSMSALNDCFCTDCELVCEMQAFEIDTLVGSGRTQEALRASMSVPENSPEIVSVYNLIAKPYISDVEAQNGRAVVSGVIDCYILYLSASDTIPISTQMSQLKFEVPVEVEGMTEQCDCDVNIEIAHQSYNITMTGEIELRVSVIAQVRAIAKNEVLLITNVFADENEAISLKNGIVVYFVQCDDTLWKIAKKYHVSPELIASANKLENDEISVGQRLLIP